MAKQELPLWLKPMDIRRLARVPYATVMSWLTTGHPRAGVLPSIDLAEAGKRHSFRIRREDWEAFLARLCTLPHEQRHRRLDVAPAAGAGKRGTKSTTSPSQTNRL